MNGLWSLWHIDRPKIKGKKKRLYIKLTSIKSLMNFHYPDYEGVITERNYGIYNFY
jgi:hypothetical protein